MAYSDFGDGLLGGLFPKDGGSPAPKPSEAGSPQDAELAELREIRKELRKIRKELEDWHQEWEDKYDY